MIIVQRFYGSKIWCELWIFKVVLALPIIISLIVIFIFQRRFRIYLACVPLCTPTILEDLILTLLVLGMYLHSYFLLSILFSFSTVSFINMLLVYLDYRLAYLLAGYGRWNQDMRNCVMIN